MTQSDDIFLSTLKRVYGYDSFRSIQLDIIRSIANGHDTLGLMPTGGGKSITFQVPALSMDGVCIVVTPLISLMKDQVMHLKEIGIKAEALYSGLTHHDMQRILDNAIYGAVKFLYVSPERLSNKLFLAKLYYMKVCFFTVDEAHCISQWGYDFRPSYLRISEIRKEKPDVPVLALTATATPQVVEDIQEKLSFGKYLCEDCNVFRMSFKRDNISYVVRHTMDKNVEMIHILNSVDGCAIIYTRNREKTKKLAQLLEDNGISATYYHAGLNHAVKDTRQEMWRRGEIRVIVATNAFGMGIDKADVRLVIHADVPDSLEAYYQEAGRAGRDGKRSYSVLLYDKSDSSLLRKHGNEMFPPKDYIRKVYDHLAYFFELATETGEGACFAFSENIFCQKFKHYPTHLENAMNILQNAGYIYYEKDPDNKARVCFRIRREELYNIENLSPLEDTALSTLLRSYGSLFSELTYVDIPYLAMVSGTSEQNFRVALKELSRRGVITYIPPRKTSTVTYLQQRIPSDRLHITRDVYEILRERSMERINAVLEYLETEDKCRQRMLVEYFGEKNTEDCEHCDVCIDKKRCSTVPDMSDRLLDILSDCRQHLLTEFLSLNLTEKQLHDALEALRKNENVTFDGPYVKYEC